MAFSLVQTTTQLGYDRLLESAIRSSIELDEPDWTSILAICDVLHEKKNHPKNILVPIQSRLKSENSKVVVLTLQILDVIVHNCGSPRLYAEILSQSFLKDLCDLTSSRDELVKKRVLTLLQTWALSLGQLSPYKCVADLVNSMKARGVQFPTVKAEDTQLLFQKPPVWTDSPSCTTCGVEFGLQILKRKHHCRACGKVFCHYCSGKTIKLLQFGSDKMERVCDPCFEQQTRWKSENSDEGEAELPLDVRLRLLVAALKQDEERELTDLAIAMSLSEQENNCDAETLAKAGLEESASTSTSCKIDSDSDSDSDSTDGASTKDNEEKHEENPHGILDCELITMDDFRDLVSAAEERQEISVKRATLIPDILAKYAPRKYAKINLLAEPSISFSGESGIDGGALRKEYFFSGMLGLDTFAVDGHPIFEGQPDHRLLSTDQCLMSKGTFYSIGRFMVHSCIHMGIAFIGLSQAASTYILMSDEDLEYEKIKRIHISLQDLPSDEALAVFHTAQKIQRGERSACTLEEIEQLDKEVFAIGFNEKVTPENSLAFQEELLFYHVISCRRFQLEEIRRAFKECKPLWEYLRARPYLHSSIFPSSHELELPASALLGLIEVEVEDEHEHQHHQVIDYFKEFISELGQGKIEGATLRQLCELWTGSPVVRGERLAVKTESGIEFVQVQACFNTFILPENIEKSKLFEQLRLACVYGSRGFEDKSLDEALSTFFGQLRQLLR